MKSTSQFYIVFQVLRRYFCEKIQDTATSSSFSCFTQFLYQRISFFTTFRTSFNIIWKRFSSQIFLFLQIHPTPPLNPHLLNGQYLLSITKVLCQFSLKCPLKYSIFFKICWKNLAKESFMYQQWTTIVQVFF